MPRTLGYRFTVRPRTDPRLAYFPVDMLRYDACWPRSTEDCVKMADACRRPQDRAVGEPQGVGVEMFSPVKPPTVDRWISFDWSVEKIETVRA